MKELGGLSAAAWEEIRKIFRATVKSRKPLDVFLFGSRARGDHQKYSDVDLVIDGRISEPRLRELRNAFAESALPVRCDIVLKDDVYEHYRRRMEMEKKFAFRLSPSERPAPRRAQAP